MPLIPESILPVVTALDELSDGVEAVEHRGRRRLWLFVALGTAAVAILAMLWLQKQVPNEPASGMAKIVVTRPSAAFPFDRTFGWEPVKGATSYRVLVSSGDARVFEVRDLTSNGVKLSETVQLPPGPYAMQVVAFNGDKPIGESPSTPFDVK